MALVAYGSDSESEGHISDEEEVGGNVILLTQTKPKLNGNNTLVNIEENVSFSQLPQPSQPENQDIEEVEDEFLQKKEVPVEKPTKPKVKIGIPSLTEFDSDDDDEPTRKKPKVVPKGSGLFALLPPPKTTVLTNKSFVPNIVAKKTQNKPIQKKEIKKPIQVIKPVENNPGSLESDNDDDDVPMESFDEDAWNQICGRKKKARVPVIENRSMEPVVDAAPVTEEPYSGLDNEAFKKLVGSGALKRHNVKLIDINEEDVVAGQDIWMTKAITDPEQKPPVEVEEPINHTAKKKHHITYLAQQAKANEQELQTQWSANKYTRKQTQAKYGF